MNELMLTEKDGIKAVDARMLHEFLGVGKKFTDWINDRIEKYGFIEWWSE